MAEKQKMRDLEAHPAAELKEVEPLKYNEIPDAIHTGVTATQEDPLFQYLIWDTPGANSWTRKARYWIFYYLAIATSVRWAEALTIEHGEALIILRDAPVEKAKLETWLDRLWTRIHILIVTFLFSLDSDERKIRREEYKLKHELALKASIEPLLPEMMNMDGESVARDKQGLGYDRELVEYASAKANHLGRAIWSNSYSQRRTALYEGCGFTTAAFFTLGETNPSWHKPPVLIRVMVRKPQQGKS